MKLPPLLSPGMKLQLYLAVPGGSVIGEIVELGASKLRIQYVFNYVYLIPVKAGSLINFSPFIQVNIKGS